MSLKLVPFESLDAVYCSPSIVTVAVCRLWDIQCQRMAWVRVTLKTRLGVVLGHWKWRRSKILLKLCGCHTCTWMVPDVVTNTFIVITAFYRCLLYHFTSFLLPGIYCSAQKKNQIHCHQTRFLGSKCTQNAFAAGAPPRSQLGDLTALPQTP